MINDQIDTNDLFGKIEGDDETSVLMRHCKEMIEMSACLNQDLEEAIELFRFTTYEFAARTVIRTLFAEIEAKMFLVHKLILVTDPVRKKVKLTPEEKLILEETSYSISQNGKIVSSQKFLPFKNKLLFTLDMCSRLFNPNVFRDTKDPRWNDVLELIKIRNRITHPKTITDLEISSNEIETFNRGQDWLRDAFQSLFIDLELFEKIQQKA